MVDLTMLDYKNFKTKIFKLIKNTTTISDPLASTLAFVTLLNKFLKRMNQPFEQRMNQPFEQRMNQLFEQRMNQKLE